MAPGLGALNDTSTTANVLQSVQAGKQVWVRVQGQSLGQGQGVRASKDTGSDIRRKIALSLLESNGRGYGPRGRAKVEVHCRLQSARVRLVTQV